jgi:hypothetical protein
VRCGRSKSTRCHHFQRWRQNEQCPPVRLDQWNPDQTKGESLAYPASSAIRSLKKSNEQLIVELNSRESAKVNMVGVHPERQTLFA